MTGSATADLFTEEIAIEAFQRVDMRVEGRRRRPESGMGFAAEACDQAVVAAPLDLPAQIVGVAGPEQQAGDAVLDRLARRPGVPDARGPDRQRVGWGKSG